jgi:hypothetical protein
MGVIFYVEPWNIPYYQLARVDGPHLMAGNTLVVKHAGCVPRCAIEFEKLWKDAGAPAGLYTNLLISHEQSNTIIDDPRIAGVALTGSVAAGKSIAARPGHNVKPTSMELGAGRRDLRACVRSYADGAGTRALHRQHSDVRRNCRATRGVRSPSSQLQIHLRQTHPNWLADKRSSLAVSPIQKEI